MVNNSYSINSINHSQPVQNISSNSVVSANTMPMTKNFVSQVSNSNKQNNNFHHNYLKRIYSANLTPSNGSTTESFLKSKSTFSPIFRHNEMATRYEMISSIPMKLYQIKKKINLSA